MDFKFLNLRHASIRSHKRAAYAVLVGLSIGGQACANNENTIQKLFTAAENNHPAFKAARFNFEASKHDLEAIQRRRWPTLTAAIESNTGARNTTPAQALQIEQNLWDGGQLKAQIAEAESAASGTETVMELERRKIYLDVVSAWQSYFVANSKQKIAKNILEKLTEYKGMMQRRVAAEVSPPVDLQVVESRELQAAVELAQAQSAMKSAKVRLVQITGVSESAVTSILNELTPESLNGNQHEVCISIECINESANSHPGVVKLRWDVTALRSRLRAKEAESSPIAYLRLSQPIDAGTGSANETNMQGSAFIGMRYTQGAGFERVSQIRSIVSRLASAEESVESARLETIAVLEGDAEDISINKLRFTAQQKAVSSANAVLESYTSQFVAARKSWLDLLNALRELSQNLYAMTEAQASMLAAVQRLRIRSGQFKDSQ